MGVELADRDFAPPTEENLGSPLTFNRVVVNCDLLVWKARRKTVVEQRQTARAMVEHWDWAAKKGLVTKATAATLSTSCRHVLRVDPEWETLDVQALDVEQFVLRFNNLNLGKYKPRSLKDYGSRFRRAVASYREYLANPAGWSVSSRRKSKAHDAGRTSTSSKRELEDQHERPPEATKSPGSSGHEYMYPIRGDFMARLTIPLDTTTVEISRLVAWARTLAVDYEPSA